MNSIKLTALALMLCLASVPVKGICEYTHLVNIYECEEDNNVLYQFDAINSATEPKLSDDVGDYFAIKKLTKLDSKFKYEVLLKRKDLLYSLLNFTIEHVNQYSSTSDLTVRVVVEVRQCDHSLSKKCTIIISILASLCLLLFSALALSLIVLKEKNADWLQKLFRRKSVQSESQRAIINLDRIQTNGHVEMEQVDPPRISMPRKSSLKPPRMDAFPGPTNIIPDISNEPPIEASRTRRKSIVTFNETTEIRS